MRLSPQQSTALRRLVRNCLSEERLRESELASQVAPWITGSTLYRLLGTHQAVTRDQADVLVHAVARLGRLDPDRVWRALERPPEPDSPPEYELAATRWVAADREGVPELLALLDGAAAASRRCIAYRRILPPFLLDEEVMGGVLAYLVGRLAPDPRKALTPLREAAGRQREAFMNDGGLGAVRDLTVITTLSNLVRMARLLPPFSGIPRDRINAAFESLIHDSVLARSVRVVTVNDLVEGPARRWAWRYLAWGSVTLFDSGLMVKRRRGTFAFRVLHAAEDSFSRHLIDHHRRDLEEAVTYACHGVSKEEVAEFLKKFLAASGHSLRGNFGKN